MELLSALIFAVAVFTASYIQAVIGFAMGMIVMAIVGASASLSLPVLTAVVSIISFTNIVVALRSHLALVNRGMLAWMVAGQLPAIALGYWLMLTLDRDWQWVLQCLLGLFVTLGSLSMVIKPQSLARLSPRWVCFSAGIGGGIVGGLFAASGPVIGWFAYRQPLEVRVIRATMLSFFGIATCVRTLLVALNDGLTSEVIGLSALALPLVVLGAWLGNRYPPKLNDAELKRGVFCLLVCMGLFIIGDAVL